MAAWPFHNQFTADSFCPHSSPQLQFVFADTEVMGCLHSALCSAH